MRRSAELYGAAPSSYDWSRRHARRRGAQAMRRLERGEWPAPATVRGLYGTSAAALLDARRLRESAPRKRCGDARVRGEPSAQATSDARRLLRHAPLQDAPLDVAREHHELAVRE